MRNKESENERPSWHRRNQKAYRVNRVLIILEIVASFVLAAVIWFGVDRYVQN